MEFEADSFLENETFKRFVMCPPLTKDVTFQIPYMSSTQIFQYFDSHYIIFSFQSRDYSSDIGLHEQGIFVFFCISTSMVNMPFCHLKSQSL